VGTPHSESASVDGSTAEAAEVLVSSSVTQPGVNVPLCFCPCVPLAGAWLFWLAVSLVALLLSAARGSKQVALVLGSCLAGLFFMLGFRNGLQIAGLHSWLSGSPVL